MIYFKCGDIVVTITKTNKNLEIIKQIIDSILEETKTQHKKNK